MAGLIEFKIKAALENDIFTHLTKCNDDFFPILESRVKIDDYALKIYEKAISFEAWDEDILIGLLAAYFDERNHTAFVTNVSLLKNYKRRGIASKLILLCTDYAKQNKIKEIRLEVNRNNVEAVALYRSNNFSECHSKGDQIYMKFLIE